MGIVNINTKEDYSSLGNGSVFDASDYIQLGGITDQQTIDAVNEFYESMYRSRLIGKFSLIRLFTGYSQSDQLNLALVGQNNSVFLNDSPEAHTKSDGYIPDPSIPRYISDSNTLIPIPIDTLHMHCFNSSAELDDSGRVLLRGTSGNNFLVELIRNQAGRTRGAIGLSTVPTNVFAPIDYPVTNTGLLSLVAQPSGGGVSVNLYDSGSEIGSTIRPAFSGNVPSAAKMMELNSFGSRITGANIRVIAYGSSEWTPSDESNFNTYCQTLHNSLT